MRYPTRTTAQIAASLNPYQRLEVAAIAADIAELRRQNPLAHLPDEPVKVWLFEQVGVVWNFETGGWEWADAQPSDWGIAYAFPGEGLRLAGEAVR
ncbi:MAG: hypothetical protein WBO46_04030 [Caldilineaceae bacterium]